MSDRSLGDGALTESPVPARLDGQLLDAAKEHIQTRLGDLPKIAVILGSGLGNFADELSDSQSIPTFEIPGYPRSTVTGHAGRWVLGKVQKKRVLVVQGRVHAYEGYGIERIGFPIHLMAALGVRRLIVTNASGSVNPRFVPGDLMLIDDHINMMFASPLRGQTKKSWGDRWPDMHAPYNPQFQKIAIQAAIDLGLPLRHGVLLAFKGPSYETAAEIEMARRLGADAITMSTIPEVLVAVSRRMQLLGISCITNMGTGLATHKLSHDEVSETAGLVKNKFKKLLKQIIHHIG